MRPNRGEHSAAAKRRQMAAAEPGDLGFAPVLPQSVRMVGWDDLVAATGNDQHAALVDP